MNFDIDINNFFYQMSPREKKKTGHKIGTRYL